MRPIIITQPTDEPLTLAECRSHLNLYAYEVDSDGVYSHPDDELIADMLTAARELCEDFTGLSFVPKTYEVAMNNFPTGAIELPMGPLVSVTSIAVANDSDGLVDADDYVVDPYSRPGRVVPVSTWPSVTAATNLILIRYISGFGEDSDGGQRLPFMARNAMNGIR